MSEYSYYEFQAVDRPLTDREIATLRGYSSRATITASRFTNSYSYGSFKGNASTWMEKYFDAFLYLASWSTHELMFRLPRRVLDPKTAQQYLKGEAAAVRAKEDYLVLYFLSEEEGGGWVEDEEGSGWMTSLLPARAELASGDLRLLYLGWLLSAQVGELKEDDVEPPVPEGLGELSGPQQAFVEFFRIDEDLIAAASERSAPMDASGSARQELERWVDALPASEKSSLLVRIAAGDEPHPRAELMRRFRGSKSRAAERAPHNARSVAELKALAARKSEERRLKEAERASREKARREREAAAARARHLDELATREPSAWKKVDELIATKKPAHYDAALQLLGDLLELADREGRGSEAERRIQRLRERHAKKPSLLPRLEQVVERARR